MLVVQIKFKTDHLAKDVGGVGGFGITSLSIKHLLSTY